MFKPNPNVVNFYAKSETWQEFGMWSGRIGFYQAQVKAKKAGSLKELASLVTGDQSDWTLLGKAKEAVAGGTIVDVAPLVVKSEQTLRNSIVELTGKFRSIFPKLGTEITSALGSNTPGTVGGVNVGVSNNITEINKYFGGQPYKFCDCNLSIRIIFSKACLDLVGEDIFRAVCAKLPKDSPKDSFTFPLLSFASTPVISFTVASLKNVKNGDWIAFANYEDYVEKMRNLYRTCLQLK